MTARPVRYYVDADLMGLAKVLANLREDVTYPSDPGGIVRKRVRPASPVVTTDVDDLDWIPVVAERSWSILTRDMKITRRPAELEAVRAHSAKLFVLDSREATNVWLQLEIVMSRWRDIERTSNQPGPFVHSVTRSRVKRLL